MKAVTRFSRLPVCFAGLAASYLISTSRAWAQPGSLDTTFDSGTGVDQTVFAMTLQTDGRILIAGDFTTVNEVPRRGITRLGRNGALDIGFHPGLGTDDAVATVAVRTNGQVI